MKIQIKYHNKNIPKIKKIEQGDLIDLYAAETVDIKAGDFKLISLGISVKLPWGYKAQVYPRSSTYKKWGITMPNSVGQIDNSYCGDGDVWMFPAKAERDTIIHEGDRICQFELVPVMQGIEIEEVETLGNTNRGGFGSTGVR